MDTYSVGNGVTRELQPGDSVMAVMGEEGDLKTIWDKSKPDEVANAKQTFDNLKAKGYLAYKVVGEKGDKGEILREFDPDAERMILSPPLMGG